jgi:hypothetical protein
MSRGGMEHLLASPAFLRHVAASLAADVALTGSDEARLALEMLTKTLLYSPDAYLLTLQALLGLPSRRLPVPKCASGRFRGVLCLNQPVCGPAVGVHAFGAGARA